MNPISTERARRCVTAALVLVCRGLAGYQYDTLRRRSVARNIILAAERIGVALCAGEFDLQSVLGRRGNTLRRVF